MKRTLLVLAIIQLTSLFAQADFEAGENNNMGQRLPQRRIAAKRQSDRATLLAYSEPKSSGFLARVSGVAGAIYNSPTGTNSNYTSPYAYNQNNSYSGTTTFTGGALVDLLPGSFVIETGLLYRQLTSNQSQFFGTSLTLTGNYLSIPTFLKYYFMNPNNTSVFAKAGAYNSFAVGQSASMSIANQSYNDSYVNVATYDFALAGGLGGNIKLSNSTFLVLEIDYARSLTAVSSSFPSSYYSMITGLGGVAFRL